MWRCVVAGVARLGDFPLQIKTCLWCVQPGLHLEGKYSLSWKVHSLWHCSQPQKHNVPYHTIKNGSRITRNVTKTVMVSGSMVLVADPLSSVGCKVGPHGLGLYRQIPQMLNWIGLWGIWRPGQCLELFVSFLWPFLSSFCSVADMLLSWWGCLLGLQHCLGVWCKSNDMDAIQVNAIWQISVFSHFIHS